VLERWTRAVVRNRSAVILLWLALVIVGLLANSNLTKYLTTSLTVPGTESATADEILSRRFHQNTEGTFTILLKIKNASKLEIEGLKVKIKSAAAVVPTAQVTEQRVLGNVLVANIGTSLKLVDASSYTDKLRGAFMKNGVVGALVTGTPAIYTDVTPVLASDLKHGQLLAVLLALLLLMLVLGTCWAVFIPFFFAVGTISATLAVVYLLAQKFLMVLYIPNIIELIGLGLAIDYSLLMVHRFRQELRDHIDFQIEDAIVTTMETAGRTVMLSGFIVAIGLATLIFVPVPFVRSLGAAGLVIPVVSVIAALTLQPALLSMLGRGGVTPKGYLGLLGRGELMSGLFARTSRLVIRRPISIFLLSSTALAIAASSILWLQVTPSSLTAKPGEMESTQALSIVTQIAGIGIITPNEIIIDLGKPNQANTSYVKQARIKLARAVLIDPEVSIVAIGDKAPYIDSTGRYLRIYVVGRHDLGAEPSQKLVQELREKYLPAAGFPQNSKIYVGGAPAQGVDLLRSILKSFPWIVFLALALAYILLVRALRSLILPLKAILLDLVSIAVAYGSLVVVFRFGIGSTLIGTFQMDQIEAWVLIFLFVVLFGLSMDYEVFIVSRMREARNRGVTGNEAIIEGTAHTGGVVTAAAAIFVGALSGLIFGHFAGLQQLGVGLALGVLIDATIIRGLLLPSAMVLLGRWNWWLPGSAAKFIRTKASPLEERETRL
jgi:RND superfamily putative drug exporter